MNKDFDFSFKGLSFKMIYIEGGNFNQDYEDQHPASNEVLVKEKIGVTRDFYLAEFPVTQALWKAVMGDITVELSNKNCEDCPMETVSWFYAKEFLLNLNQIGKMQFRLPTSTEWEYAARGGRKSKGYKFAGSNDLEMVGWFKKNSNQQVQPVGRLAPNELMLFDMSGNVWEWCENLVETNIHGKRAEDCLGDPEENGDFRVIRGGAWSTNASNCRTSFLSEALSGHFYPGVGFRLAHDVLAETIVSRF
mgnify:CR=1 FL=1